MLLVFEILALEVLSVGVFEDALAVEFSVFEFASVHAIVVKLESAFSLDSSNYCLSFF